MNQSSGAHSAMAIQRQRRHWEEKAPRRSSAHPSSRLLSRGQSYTGMLHVGVCCLVVGLVLLAAGTLPFGLTSLDTGTWQKELMATGIMVLVIGIYLIILYPIMNKCEGKGGKESHSQDVESGYSTIGHCTTELQSQRETEEFNNSEVPQQDETTPIALPKTAEFVLEKIEEEDMSEREETRSYNSQRTELSSFILDNRQRERTERKNS